MNTPSASQQPSASQRPVLNGASTPAAVVQLTPATPTAIAGSGSTSAIESVQVQECAWNKHKRKVAKEQKEKRQKEEEEDEEEGLQADKAALI